MVSTAVCDGDLDRLSELDAEAVGHDEPDRLWEEECVRGTEADFDAVRDLWSLTEMDVEAVTVNITEISCDELTLRVIDTVVLRKSDRLGDAVGV